MQNFFNVLVFYERRQLLKQHTPEEITSIVGLDINDATLLGTIAQQLEDLLLLVLQNPFASIDLLVNQSGLSVNETETHLLMLQIVHPGVITVANIADTKYWEEINHKKEKLAIEAMTSEGLFDHEVASKLNLPIQTIKAFHQNLPATLKRNDEFEAIKREAIVREFFKLYPYATVSESAKSLKMQHREVRAIIESMKSCGEVVKYNDTPRPVEFEIRKNKVVAMKRENPGLSDRDISTSLGISTSQVREAIQDTARIWQMERASSFDFYVHKTMDDLEIVKRECMNRHLANPQTSSRWLEIYLNAEEKKINVLGLKAPERLDIKKEVTISKTDRDAVVDAYMSTNCIDVDFDLIEITGNKR